MLRAPRATLAVSALLISGCDREPTVMAPVSAPDAAIVEHLRSVGYRGPAIIARRTVSDEHGTRPRGGETVERSTFSAVLNGVDVTSQFRANSRGDVVAVFAPGSSAAQPGRNVLLLKVDGHILGTTRTATDADRFSFTLP